MFHFSLPSRLGYRKNGSSSTGKFLCPFYPLIYFCLVITKIIQMVNILRLECTSRASLVAQIVKNLPAVQETWVQSLMGRSPGGGHGNPHQYFCLENAMDRGAWEAAVYGVTKSWTRLNDSAHTHASLNCFDQNSLCKVAPGYQKERVNN